MFIRICGAFNFIFYLQFMNLNNYMCGIRFLLVLLVSLVNLIDGKCNRIL